MSQLADFRFHIHYKPEVKNGDADGLSCMPLYISRYTEQCSPGTNEAVVNAVKHDKSVHASIGISVKDYEREESYLLTDGTLPSIDIATLVKEQQQNSDRSFTVLSQ